MGNIIKFTSLMAQKNPEKKLIEPDSNGYRVLTLGALNMYNSAGAFYPMDSAVALFEASSSLMRRISKGQLRGELGHPKKLPGMTMREYMGRAVQIYENNVCAHFKEVWLDEDAHKSDPSLPNGAILIKGKVKPAGPHANSLEMALSNPEENVAFSIRSLTKDNYNNGRLEKNIKQIITWDYVNEPGMAKANQWSDLGIEDLTDVILDLELLETIVEEERMFGNENDKSIASETLEIIKEIKKVNVSLGVHSKW
jgi:hypothetical protein